MNMAELSEEYRASAALCRDRARTLRERLREDQFSQTERMILKRRINMLSEMAADAGAIAKYLRRYYGRGGVS